MLSDTPLQDLQAAYRALKGIQRTPDVAAAMGLSTHTLHRFEQDRLVSLQALQAIAAWVREHRGQAHERFEQTRTRDEGMGW